MTTCDNQITPSRRFRGIVSCLLIFHFAAIIVASWSVAPASLLSARCWSVFQPYLQATFLNHGYHFFAPEPGPSHLVRYEWRTKDGETGEGIFPDLSVQRPRLLYHRHFMMSEFVNQVVIGEAEPSFVQSVKTSLGQHLCEHHDAEEVTMFLRRHYIPSPQQIHDELALDDASLYAERPLGTHRREPL